MKTAKYFLLILFLLLLPPSWVEGQAPTRGLCSQLSLKCSSTYEFSPYHLPFEIREKLIVGKTYKSAPFYAVVLKSVKASGSDDCGYISEEERLEVQKLFHDRKVFASRVSCPEELILYTNVNQDFNFLAVYAGASQSEARQMLKKIKALGRYPQSYIRRMQVVLEFST
jgi:hypothetical protein